MKKAKVLLTRSTKKLRKLYGSVPVVQKKVQRRTHELEVFERYVADIVFTIKGNPLEYANSLHKNVQFTLETLNAHGNLAFLDLNMNVNDERQISCRWYQKSTDTGLILNFRSCAPLQHKKTLIQRTVHMIFNSTSDRQSFGGAPKKNQEIWGLKISIQLSALLVLTRRWVT